MTFFPVGLMAHDAGSKAEALLGSEPQGLAIDFTDSSMAVRDTGTIANLYDSTGTVVNGALVGPGGKLTYTSPSPKLTLQSTGYYAYQAHNTTTYSNTFTNAVWTKNHCTVTAAAATSPDGTVNATKVIPGVASHSAQGIHNVTDSVTTATVSMSVYLKAAGYSQVYLREAQTTGSCVVYTLSGAGTVDGTYAAGATFSNNTITSVGNGWYRLTTTMSYGTSDARSFQLCVLDGSYVSGDPGAINYTGDGSSGVYIYNAQIETGSVANSAIITTSAALYSLPTEYNTSSVCQGVLIEEQRTNLLLQSNTFGTTWTPSNITNLTTTTTGPDGVSGSATLLNETVTNGAHLLYQNLAKAASALPYIFTVYAKQGPGRTRLWMRLDDNAGTNAVAVYDLAGGQVGVAANGAFTAMASSIVSVGNGWYRCILQATSNTVATLNGNFATDNGSGTGATSISFAGTVGQGVYIYQAQLEQASYVSSPLGGSPIVTTTASVTRAADNISLATSTFPFNASGPMTFYCYATMASVVYASRAVGFAGGISPLYQHVSNTLVGSWNGSTEPTATAGSGGWSTGAKVANAFDNTGQKLCFNNGTVVTNVATFSALGTPMYVGADSGLASFTNGYIKQLMTLPRKASSVEIGTITT